MYFFLFEKLVVGRGRGAGKVIRKDKYNFFFGCFDGGTKGREEEENFMEVEQNKNKERERWETTEMIFFFFFDKKNRE